MLLIKNAQLFRAGSSGALAPGLFDLYCKDAMVAGINRANLPNAHHERDETPQQIIDAAGGLLLPGLRDHHMHLFATAAAEQSVDCSALPDNAVTELQQRLSAAPTSDWVRGVNYHERIAGALDKNKLDRLIADRPVRLQHATGKMWFLNSMALDQLGLQSPRTVDGIRLAEIPGLECDAQGVPNGRFFRADAWLGRRLNQHSPPNLGALSRRLAGFGITGVTDTSASNNDQVAQLLANQQDTGGLQQRVRLMGSRELRPFSQPKLCSGELKILLDEYALPDLDELIGRIQQAHAADRGVAFHCVTQTELVFALSALSSAFSSAQSSSRSSAQSSPHNHADRIEHASIVPAATVPLIHELNLTLVTQPGLIATRGDQYRRDLDSTEQRNLYRCGTLLREGVRMAAGSDAPYGPLDPWLSMQTAVDRCTASGVVLGRAEGITPEQALGLFLGPAEAAGNGRYGIEPGERADLCLLHKPWQVAREHLTRELVRATFIDGVALHR